MVVDEVVEDITSPKPGTYQILEDFGKEQFGVGVRHRMSFPPGTDKTLDAMADGTIAESPRNGSVKISPYNLGN